MPGNASATVPTKGAAEDNGAVEAAGVTEDAGAEGATTLAAADASWLAYAGGADVRAGVEDALAATAGPSRCAASLSRCSSVHDDTTRPSATATAQAATSPAGARNRRSLTTPSSSTSTRPRAGVFEAHRGCAASLAPCPGGRSASTRSSLAAPNQATAW